jgi:hypothetical protein
VTIPLDLRTPEEIAVLAEVRRAGAFASDGDVLRVALWKLARHLDVPMTPEAFGLPYTPPVVAEELAVEPEQTPLFDEAEGEAAS